MLLQTTIKQIRPFEYYWINPSPPTTLSGLENLIEFLFSNIRTLEELNEYLNLLHKLKVHSLSSNTYSFEIKNNGTVEVAHLYLEDLPEFSTTRTNMIKILNDWHSIWKQQPPYIKITMDAQQKVTFIPLSTLENI